VFDYLKSINNKTIKYAQNLGAWKCKIGEYKQKYPSYSVAGKDKIEPNYFFNMLSGFLPKKSIVCVDIGQNQMWSAQSLLVDETQRFLTQGGMAAMGFSMPMSIGASFAAPDSTIVVITGDGGFQLNIQELETIKYYKLPIKIILLNNNCYGMVRQMQQQYFNSRFQSTVEGYSCPDFTGIVSAYKIRASKISKASNIKESLKDLFKDKKASYLEIAIDQNCLVLPKLSVNNPIELQDPQLSKEELSSNMF
jgi:acetolactate synthase-1/2/3 large subunit